jgi:hypothetical protein
MSRQLPVLIPDRRPAARAVETPSTVARVIAAVAPDVIRLAERAATQRLAQRQRLHEPAARMPDHTEAIHVSEVEIDVAMPFVRRITMRNMTAWQNGPAPVEVVLPERRSGSKLGKAGLLGASGVIALVAGLMVRRVGPFAANRKSIIDVSGRTRS